MAQITPLQFSVIKHSTPQYRELVALRFEILRKPIGLTFTDEQLADEYKDFHLAAYMGNELVACLLMLPINNEIVKMRQVAVKENMQGKGVGKQLVKFSEEWARQTGFSKIELNARQTAVPFYLSMQYKTTGQPFTEVGLPHYKMYKLL